MNHREERGGANASNNNETKAPTYCEEVAGTVPVRHIVCQLLNGNHEGAISCPSCGEVDCLLPESDEYEAKWRCTICGHVADSVGVYMYMTGEPDLAEAVKSLLAMDWRVMHSLVVLTEEPEASGYLCENGVPAFTPPGGLLCNIDFPFLTALEDRIVAIITDGFEESKERARQAASRLSTWANALVTLPTECRDVSITAYLSNGCINCDVVEPIMDAAEQQYRERLSWITPEVAMMRVDSPEFRALQYAARK